MQETTSSKPLSVFLRKLLLLCLPFVVYYGVAFAIMVRSGELTAPAVVAEQSAKEKLIYGPAYSNPARYYKWLCASQRKAPVLAIGTSRIMAVRDIFFRDRHAFYNAGGCVDHIGLYRPFLESLPADALPKVVLISCDQFHYNPAWLEHNVLTPAAEAYRSEKTNPFTFTFLNAQKLYGDVFSGKIRTAGLLSAQEGTVPFGMNARMNENGFLSDGSYRYGMFIRDSVQRKESLTSQLGRIDMECCNFEPSSTISPRSVSMLEDFLRFCREKNIHVIGILPPFGHTAYERMIGTGKYSYLQTLPPVLATLFGKYGYRVHDYTNLRKIQPETDREAVDAFHASEKAYLRIFIGVAEKDSILASYTDIPYLKKRLEECPGDMAVFGIDE